MIQNTDMPRQVKYSYKLKTGHRFAPPCEVTTVYWVTFGYSSGHSWQESGVCAGAGYDHALSITKCIQHAVVFRMADIGGWCFPDFIKKGVQLFLLVDTIDFHMYRILCTGVTVVFQEEDQIADHINLPLIIPGILCSLHVNIKYTNLSNSLYIKSNSKLTFSNHTTSMMALGH